MLFYISRTKFIINTMNFLIYFTNFINKFSIFRIFYLASLRAKTQTSAPVMPASGADACQTTLLLLQFFLNFLRCPRTARGSLPPRELPPV